MTNPTLPPGQIVTKRFPVVGERAPSPGIETWSLEIGGLVTSPRVLSLTDYMSLNHRELVFDIHCVTSWSRLGSRFRGVPLAEMVEPVDEARFVSFQSFSERDHHTSLPLDYALEHSWLAHEFEGEPLTAEHGGPVRLVTPGKYFYKSLKWLKAIEVLAEDRLGWWETNSSYHNNADPVSGRERFTSGSLRPEQLERFRLATNFGKYRGRVLLGLDLAGWKPASSDMRRIYLKNCDLSEARLAELDLRESNLSLSNLAGAKLAKSDLSGSDLEGADFSGADLSGANLSGTALSATRFDGAIVAGAKFDQAWGLVESQQTYLAGQGVRVS